MHEISSRFLNVILVVAALLLLAFPLADLPFYIQLLSRIMIMAIFAMSLDLLVGYTGLVSLGHAAFFGLAGYLVALMTPDYEAPNILTTLPAAIGMCALFALVTGFLVLRTSGIYFIMVTLAFAQMLFFVFHDTDLGGGSDGIYIYVRPEIKIGDTTLVNLDDPRHFYYVAWFWMVACFVFLRVMLRSAFGHALLGIKTNEHRMRALGFPAFHYKLASYVISGSLAGLAGYLAALQFGFVNPEILSWHQSGNVLMMVILGGMGTLFGPVVGAFALVMLQEVFSNQSVVGSFAEHWQLLMGMTIILVALFLPTGLAGLVLQTGRKKMVEAEDD